MIIHTVGQSVQIGNRTIQRCAICGFKLVDGIGPPTWAVGTCVGTWETKSRSMIKEDVVKEENFCITLVEP